MKKVILTRPRYQTHLITPPLGLGYISSYLESKGHKVDIVDGLNLNLSPDNIVERCLDADYVGISVLSAYYKQAVDLAKKLVNKGIKVVVGGPHATCLPEETIRDTGADYVVTGEGEISFAELIEKEQEGLAIPGVLKRDNGQFVKRRLIADLDSIPFPDWRKMDPGKYKKAPHGGLIKYFPVAPVISTRGCPYECTFCASPMIWERSIRYRSAENVVAEIEYLIKDFGVREIHFEDDNLTLKREHIAALCSLILKRGIKIAWATPNGVRADTLDKEILKLMKESGCYYLVFGIESGNQEILDNVKKKESLETIKKAVTDAHQMGFLTQGFFIFGLPGETQETMNKTIEFAKNIPLDRAQFLLLDVFPGCELWEKLKCERIVNWDYNSYQEATWLPPGLDRDTLMKAQSDAFKTFFYRPSKLYSLIKHFKLSQLPFVLKRLRDFRILGGKCDKCE